MDARPTAGALHSRPAAIHEVVDFVVQQFAARPPDRALRLVLPLDVAPLAHLGAADDLALVWHSGELELVGLGEAYVLEATGEDRFAQIRAAAERRFAEIDTVCFPGPGVPLDEPPAPRFFGGLSFTPGSASAGPWQSFGDARFVLPVLALVREGAALRVELTRVPGAELSPETLAARLVALVEAAKAHPRPPGAGSERDELTAPMLPSGEVETDDEHEWCERIEEIRRAIASGDVDKIVAAREVRCARPEVEARELLRGLHAAMPECSLFGVAAGRATFLGASPERLITRAGTRIRSHALAGSIRPGTRGHGQQASVLLESAKDRWEHQLVVDHLVAHLRSCCRELTWPDVPKVKELRNVLHLETPILGELGEQLHVLDLVARLHPTPAVGGVPSPAAEEWIREREPAPRGWYAGPVGWFDARGDGDFAVAIRSGLVTSGEVRLYSGAGIVADSEPALEHDETELKLTPLRRLLHEARPAQ